jgi:hypothetical protein
VDQAARDSWTVADSSDFYFLHNRGQVGSDLDKDGRIIYTSATVLMRRQEPEDTPSAQPEHTPIPR